MSNTYTFTKQKLHYHTVGNFDQVVYSIDWILTGQNNNNSAQLTGSTAIPFNDKKLLIDLTQLNDTVIEQWIIDNTDNSTLQIHYLNLDTQLALMLD